MSASMYCTKCKNLRANGKFCWNCGEKLENGINLSCGTCGSQVQDPTDNFCRECGEKANWVKSVVA